jgi:23S rRNA (guanosine2251-2'-O)-methyltransferase
MRRDECGVNSLITPHSSRFMSHFAFVECAAPDCRLRFPLIPSVEMAVCPRCGGALHTAATIPTAAAENLPSVARVGPPLTAVLDNIRSAYNVGSMFRTADGAGLSHLYLAGITATPEHPKVAKTALSAEQVVGWSYHPHGPTAVADLQAQGYQIVALEMTDSSRPLTAVPLDPLRPAALVVGNEICGVDPAILALADYVGHLPMYGRKRSLNAAVAFGVAAYWLAGFTA